MDIQKLEKGNELRSKITTIKAKLSFISNTQDITTVSVCKKKSPTEQIIETFNFSYSDGVNLKAINDSIRTQLEKKLQALEEEFNNL